MRIAYIFTTFPKLSERFFLREVVELRRQGLEFDLYSIVGGSDDSEAGVVTRMRWTDWLLVWGDLVYWFISKPRVVLRFIVRLNPFLYRSAINWAENAVGLAFAVRFARRFREIGYSLNHGTWATAPGMAVWVLEALIGQRYTLEAHAYDVWRDGGDAFLEVKLSGARALRSSTEATAAEMERRLDAIGCDSGVVCVRRGLDIIQDYREGTFLPGSLIRVLSVGRLIEKKGYFNELEVFRSWSQKGVNFQVKIIGEGPLLNDLQSKIQELALGDFVSLCGRLDYSEVDQAYRSADLFLFCGKVSGSGDRDGFPNVIGEAMSHSLPVFSTDVSGTTEGIKEGETGYILDLSKPDVAAEIILERMQSREAIARITKNAHAWVENEFSTERNVSKLRAALWG